MKIRIETIETAAGPMHDLVLVKGANTVRLKLTCLSPELAAAQLGQWIEDNTMYVAEIAGPRPIAGGRTARELISGLRQLQAGGGL